MARRTFQATSFGFSRALKPSPIESVTRESETSSSSMQGNIPQAQVGIPIVGIQGRKRVPDANTIWTGNLRPLTETKTETTSDEEVVDGQTITTTKTVTTTAIVGYLVDIHMGICTGPGVHCVGIYVDNQPIWTGDLGPARETVTLPINETFLSGVSAVFSGGAYDQAPEPDVDVVDYPGYVGVATMLLKNVRADLPMGNLSFEVVRVPNPLGLSDANNRSGDDVNVITCLTETMTNPWGWGGLDISNFDVAGLTAMAIQCKNEGNFASMKIGTEMSVPAVVKSLQDQAACIVFQSSETGLIKGSLIRASNINYVSSPRFNMNNVYELRNWQKTYWPDTIEQARGLYTERDADYNELAVFAQNSANISQSGRGKRTASIYYPYVPNKSLCSDLLSRDMATIAAPTYSFSLLTNRDGATLEPGSMILVGWQPYDLLNLPMVVLEVGKQDIKNNTCLLGVRQMDFPDTTPLFGAGGPGYDPGFDTSPQAPTDVIFLTAPYYMARARNGITSGQVSPLIYPLILPKPANDFQFSFGAVIENVPGTSGNTELISDGLYPTFADLVTPVGIFDDTTDGVISTLTINDVINGVNLVDIGNSGVREGRLFLIVGDEIMSFESVTDNGDGSWDLNNVHRALLDTVPGAHSAGADCYIINNNFNNIPQSAFPYPLGYVPDWVITSNSITEHGQVVDGFSSDDWVPSANRTLAPPRPHNTKINGGARSSSPVALVIGGSVTVTWATRTRLAGNVKLQLDSAETPEINGGVTQVHRVMVKDSANVDHDCGDVVGNTHTFNLPSMATGAGFLWVQAETEPGGNLTTSIYQDRLPVTIS